MLPVTWTSMLTLWTATTSSLRLPHTSPDSTNASSNSPNIQARAPNSAAADQPIIKDIIIPDFDFACRYRTAPTDYIRSEWYQDRDCSSDYTYAQYCLKAPHTYIGASTAYETHFPCPGNRFCIRVNATPPFNVLQDGRRYPSRTDIRCYATDSEELILDTDRGGGIGQLVRPHLVAPYWLMIRLSLAGLPTGSFTMGVDSMYGDGHQYQRQVLGSHEFKDGEEAGSKHSYTFTYEVKPGMEDIALQPFIKMHEKQRNPLKAMANFGFGSGDLSGGPRGESDSELGPGESILERRVYYADPDARYRKVDKNSSLDS